MAWRDSRHHILYGMLIKHCFGFGIHGYLTSTSYFLLNKNASDAYALYVSASATAWDDDILITISRKMFQVYKYLL